MRFFLFTIASLFTLTVFGQYKFLSDTVLPSDGFTNKAEAKNESIPLALFFSSTDTTTEESRTRGKEMVKEGKWVEYYNRDEFTWIPANATNARYYSLTVYKDNTPVGTIRTYYRNGLLYSKKYTKNDKQYEVREIYDTSGHVSHEALYINGIYQGNVKDAYKSSNKVKQNPIDSGFTNKIEAKNQTVNGKKEGKWCEYSGEVVETDLATHKTIKKGYDTNSGYRLVIYKNGLANGTVRDYNKEGELIQETPYRMGMRNGIAKEYLDKGILFVETPYVNDSINGIEKFYYLKSGKVCREEPFINNKKNGVQKEYYENGKLKKEVPYVLGEKNGINKEYFKNGTVKHETPYSKGEKDGVEKEYYATGELHFETGYSNGKKNGVEKEYYTSGKLVWEEPFTDGKQNGVTKTYNEEGALLSECPWNKGEINGVEKLYYDNGQLKSEIIYNNGVKGETKNYDENGNEIKK